MELRLYWQIIKRRIWIPIVLVLLVGGISAFTRQPTSSSTFNAALRFTIIVETQTLADTYTYDGYYAWVSSEYLSDLLSVVAGSEGFAADVNQHLQEAESPVRLSAGMITAQTLHRTLQLSFSWPNEAELRDISQAITLAMEKDTAKYLVAPNMPQAIVTPIDKRISPVGFSASLTQRLDIPIRLSLALLAGLGLSFILHYLDTKIRTAEDLEKLDINILAQVPKYKK